MQDGKRTNRERWAPTARRAGATVLVPLLLMCAAQAQTPVTPAGSGLQGDPYQISQLGHLVWMGDNVGSSSGKYYVVQNDMDASATTNWNSGAGFAPIGTSNAPFMGVLDGGGRTISRLTINRPGQEDVGLFGYVGRSSTVEHLRLTGYLVRGSTNVGSIAGFCEFGTVDGCFATGTVAGS